MNLDQQIESLLFWKGEAVAIRQLAEWLEAKPEEIKESLEILKQKLSGRGVTLVETSDTVILATVPEMSGVIGRLAKSEMERDLGKAGLETLTTIIYRAPVSRAEVDYIRGVNSSFSVRQLITRGLIERIEIAGRRYAYQPTTDLLRYLGIGTITDLPDYQTIRTSLDALLEQQRESETSDAAGLTQSVLTH